MEMAMKSTAIGDESHPTITEKRFVVCALLLDPELNHMVEKSGI
jgi:hypothetical protein